MRYATVAVVLALAASGANAQAVIDGSDAPFERKEVAVVIRMVTKHLRDPSSAELKSLVTTSGGYCGLVNAKTRFGGYAGFRKFVVWMKPEPIIVFQATRNDGQFENSAVILPLPNPGQGCLPNS